MRKDGGAGRQPGLSSFPRTAGVAVLAVLMFVIGAAGLSRGGGGGAGSSMSPPGPAGHGSAPAQSPLVGAASLQQAIVGLQRRLPTVPRDWRSYAELGLAYVAEARVTSDPSYYPKAEGVLGRSLRLNRSQNYEALTGMGALAAARHDFAGALLWGERARSVNRYNANVYGVIGDAQIELGRYGEAFRTLQRMVDLRPDLSSYARVSYARELQGDVPGAIQAMKLALFSAGGAEDAAFASYQLGELSFNSGDVRRAEAYYRRAVELSPDYFPPQAGLAKVAWAEGHVATAIRLYTAVVERYPSPEYVAALGDLYRVSGRRAEAAREYALVRTEERLFRANGVNVDLELSLFDADHGRAVDALRAARAEWGRRHSIHVADALAWALYANGRYGRALRLSRRATSLGYRNALFYFHRGMIELGLGDREAARRDLRIAVGINARFSILHAPQAGRVLARLRSAGTGRAR